VQLELVGYLIGAGELDEAEDLCRRALAEQPNHSTAYLFLGQIAEARGEWKESQSFYECALELNPQQEAARQGFTRVEEKLRGQSQP
jgi:Tfp pilus assembly protein PilF